MTVIRAPIRHDLARAASSRVFVIAPPKKIGRRSYLPTKTDDKKERTREKEERKSRSVGSLRFQVFSRRGCLTPANPSPTLAARSLMKRKILPLSPVRSALLIGRISRFSFMTIIRTIN